MIEIIQAETEEQMKAAQNLFREYEARLKLDLCFQDFDREVAELPGNYVAPEGKLLLAVLHGKFAGCIALRKLERGICEMKRLFVKEDFRGLGIGNKLVERLINEARLIGYEKMRLDTYPPKMAKAVELYESHGFRKIPPYYQNPFGETLYMEKALQSKK